MRRLSRERAAKGRAQIRYQGRSQALARSRPRAAQPVARIQSPPRRTQRQSRTISDGERRRGHGPDRADPHVEQLGEEVGDAVVADPALVLADELGRVEDMGAEGRQAGGGGRDGGDDRAGEEPIAPHRAEQRERERRRRRSA